MNTLTKSKTIADEPKYDSVRAYIKACKHNLPTGAIISTVRAHGFESQSHGSHVISGKAVATNANITLLLDIYEQVQTATARAERLADLAKAA